MDVDNRGSINFTAEDMYRLTKSKSTTADTKTKVFETAHLEYQVIKLMIKRAALRGLFNLNMVCKNYSKEVYDEVISFLKSDGFDAHIEIEYLGPTTLYRIVVWWDKGEKEDVLNLTYGTPFYDPVSGLWKQEIRLEDARAYPSPTPQM